MHETVKQCSYRNRHGRHIFGQSHFWLQHDLIWHLPTNSYLHMRQFGLDIDKLIEMPGGSCYDCDGTTSDYFFKILILAALKRYFVWSSCPMKPFLELEGHLLRNKETARQVFVFILFCHHRRFQNGKFYDSFFLDSFYSYIEPCCVGWRLLCATNGINLDQCAGIIINLGSKLSFKRWWYKSLTHIRATEPTRAKQQESNINSA